MATVSLGTIQEADGVREHSWWLRNGGATEIVVRQGYTSCGCTQIEMPAAGSTVAPGDSAKVTLRFNPRGKGGEFHEVGTVVYAPATQHPSTNTKHPSTNTRKSLQLTLTGTCITSEETLMRQFPVRINDDLRLSANRFDVGPMRVGERKERTVVILHRDEQNRQERIVVPLVIDATIPKGVQHIVKRLTTRVKGKAQSFNVTFDVLVR